MRKYIVLAILLYALPAGAVNWTFTDNVTVQENLAVTGTATFTGAPVFTDNTVNGTDLLDNTVTSAKILDNSVLTGKIADGTILNADIADNTITSAKLLDNTVALAKIAHTGTASSSTFLRGDASWAGGIGQLSGFKNLEITTPADNQSVTITADKVLATDNSDTSLVLSTVSLTVDLDAAGANGLDTGSVAYNTGYFLWVVSNGTTTAGLASASATAPTMPAGYTYKALVGWCTTDNTATPFNIEEFTQYGDEVWWTVPQLEFSGTLGTTTVALDFSSAGLLGYASVPPNAKKVNIRAETPTGYYFVNPTTFANTQGSTQNAVVYYIHFLETSTPEHQNFYIPLLETQKIYHQHSNSQTDYVWVTGFILK